MNQNELYHFGIKGMHWGVRRFQNKNGDLTAAGKKRYSDNGSGEQKTTHRQKLEQQYIKSGMSQKQAAMAANRRIQTEKIVLAAAGLTLTAAAVYAANKYVKNRTDQIISSDKLLQRIEMQDTGGKLHDVFYAAKDKADKTKYAGMLGKTRQMQTGHAYIMELQAKSDIKVAAKKNAEKVFKDLYDSDSDFRSAINKIGDSNIHGRNSVNLNGKLKLNGKDLTKAYENFNSKIVDRDNSDTANKFYAALKAKGYGAIQDVNDMKFSGYNAKNPVIVFDNVQNNIMVKSMREMSNGEINAKYAKVVAGMLAKDAGKKAAIVGGIAAVSNRASNTASINKYRKAHPNTEKSDKEILKMLEKG